MSTIKWIDLRDNTDKARLKVATVNTEDGRQRRFLFIVGMDNRSGRWNAAMDKLGFVSSPRGKYLTREVREGERIQAANFHSVWPNATLSEMSRDQVLLDLAPARQARETLAPRTEEEKGVALETGTVVRLGRNGDGLEVYLSPMGRFVRRDDGVNIQETDLLGPEMFLRAPDSRALSRCADGFVRSMLLGEVQHSDDLDRFLRGVMDREGPFPTADYERVATVIDAALVRYLNGGYETAQDAYGDANRLYDYLPPYKGAHRGKGAMPLPVAVIAQRLLGDTADKRVLVPNAWDGASFAFLARGSRICAFRGDKDLSRLVTQVREEDTTWSDTFEPAREQGADGLFFNADPVRDASGAREDYRQALGALRALNPSARAVLVLAGDNPRQPGEIGGESRRFMEALARRFDIETAVEIGAELSRQVGTDTGLRIIALRNRPGTEHSWRMDSGFPVVHSWDELKSHIDEVIVTIDLREAATQSIDVDRIVRENEFQRPYLAFSKVGEAVTMVPKNLQGPLQFALSNLEKTYGPVDRFVEQELGFGANTLGDRFSPEQVDALGLGIARIRAGRGIIIGDETGIGKGRAQPMAAKVLTPSGWRRMGDIKTGDQVISVDGTATDVTGVYPQGRVPVYEVSFSDGAITRASGDHLWLTMTRNQRFRSKTVSRLPSGSYATHTTEELRDKLYQIHSVPLASAIQFSHRPVPIDPYLLGVLIGDACIRLNGIQVVLAEDEMVAAVAGALPAGTVLKHRNRVHFDIVKPSAKWKGLPRANNEAVIMMRLLGLAGKRAHEKFVPEAYLFNTSEIRLSVLQGLLDTDGTVSTQGAVSFTTVSYRLAGDVISLIRSLGGTATVTTKKTRCREAYNVFVRLPSDVAPFRLQRKAARMRAWTKYQPTRYITDIRLIEDDVCQCISVAHPSRLYVTDDFVVTHNTLSGMATWAQKQGKLVIFVTDRANLFSDLVRDLRDIEEWSRFRPFVMNSDGVLVDVFTNEVLHRGTSAKDMAQVLADNEKLDASRANILFLTYSQISGETSAKADWVLSQASDALVVVDEAHVAAGSDSNTSSVVVDLVSRAWGAVYSSATWAKTSENLHVYQRAMPETINMASLSDTMRTGGEAFSELFSSMLARDGAFIRREHDLSKIEFVVEVDTKRAGRNAELSDKVAEILAAMTYVAGDVNKILSKLNTDTTSVLKKARAARTGSVSVSRAEGRMFRSHFGAGSVLYQVMRRFLAVINTDHVTDLALKAIAQNRKPVIVFEDTGESFVQRLIKDRVIPGIEGEPAIYPDAVPPPTIRDMLRSIMKRLGVITTYKATEEDVLTAAERRARDQTIADEEVDIEQALARQDEDTEGGAAVQFVELPGVSVQQQHDWEQGMQRILAMIDALPPMPLNAIDVMHARMADAGLRVGEISGRSLRLEAPESERAEPIESQRWADFKWKIVPRQRKKTDVSRTVYEFNNGDLDLLFINRSAATGLSLHSSPRFGDTRRRELLESQIPENPTDRIQLYGRVNRYDQLVTPRIAIPTTGIYGEVRQLMMQNKKLARLSANIRSSRENAAEIKFVPDLINRIGEEVAHRYLEDNGGIRSRLGISEAEMNTASTSLIQRLTSRVALLRVSEQKAVYEEIYEMFDDAIARYELAGENPLKAKELDLRARVVDSKLVIGVDMEGVGSAFDGPVHLKKIAWKEDCKPLLWDRVQELIRGARKQLVDEGYAKPLPYAYPPAELIKMPARRMTRQQAVDRLLGQGALHEEPELDNLQGELLPDAADLSEEAADDAAEALQGDLGVPALAVVQSALLAQAHPFGTGVVLPLPVVDDGQPQEPGSGEAADLPYSDDPMGISLDRLTQQLLTVLEARMVLELLGTKFPSVEAALADPEKNGIKRALARKMWVARHLPQLVPGCAVGIGHDVHHGDGTKSLMRDWALVVGLRPPPKGKEAQLPRWKVDLLFPGDDKPRAMTMAALMDGVELIGVTREGVGDAEVTGTHLVDGDMYVYHERPHWDRDGHRGMYARDRLERIRSDFDHQFVGTRNKKCYILDGNMYLASEWAQATKQGRGVIYTDDRGLRHRAVMLNSRTSVDLMEHMPVRLWSVPMVSQFLRRMLAHHAEQANGAAQVAPNQGAEAMAPTRATRGDYLIFSTSYHGALPSGNPGKKGTQVLLIPGKGVAMTLERSDIKRAGRALRSYQKTQLRREQEAAALAASLGHEPRHPSEVKIATTAAKGKTPMIFLECTDAEGFDKAVDLLCHAAGVELYLPRGTVVGEIALGVQRDYFDARRREALQIVQAGQTPPEGVTADTIAYESQRSDESEQDEAADAEAVTRERLAA